jgi:SAM-dependent methyltransferase
MRFFSKKTYIGNIMTDINCIVCGNSEGFKVYLKGTKGHPNYVKCPTCGFVFANPVVPLTYYQDEEEYFGHKGDTALSARMANYEIRLDGINKHLDNGKKRFLDIGTHTGIFLKLLKSKGIEAVGVELNKKAAKYGREEYGVNILTEPLDQITELGPFDVVTLFNVFEHFEDPLSALPELKRLTKVNGIIAMEIPYICTPQATIFRGFWHHFYNEHFWFYDRKTMTILLEKYGFKVEKAYFVPKVTTLAWVIFIIAVKCGILSLFPKLPDYLPNWRIYKYLDKIIIKVNIADYLFVIARREE